MLLSAVVTRDELALLVESITPLRVVIDERRGRTMTVMRPNAIELVPSLGLRIRGAAQMSWDVAGVGIPITLQSWQVVVAPRIATRGGSQVLAFEPVLENVDLKRVPGFVDDRIVEAVQKALAQHGSKLAWNLTRALSRRWALSTRVVPRRAFALTVADSSVEVTAEQLRLTIRLDARFEQLASAEKQPAAEATRSPTQGTRPPAEATRPPAEATRPPAKRTLSPFERLRAAAERVRAAQAARAAQGRARQPTGRSRQSRGSARRPRGSARPRRRARRARSATPQRVAPLARRRRGREPEIRGNEPQAPYAADHGSPSGGAKL